MTPGILESQSSRKTLADQLRTCPDIVKFDAPEWDEAGTVAHALGDLEESFRTFLDVLLPKLMMKGLKPAEISDVLLEIGEEFRHVLYHISDPRFYRYLREP